MLQIPKNVMQIGQSNPHCKVYVEDYVHTFLKQRKKEETYLAFGKKEEVDGVLYYLIYGAEKKTDWDRGSMPYFKKYDRLGTLEGTAEKRIFRPVRQEAMLLDSYFVFYEQNEDMQSYMITVREKEGGLQERETEKEPVLEAVKMRREANAARLEMERPAEEMLPKQSQQTPLQPIQFGNVRSRYQKNTDIQLRQPQDASMQSEKSNEDSYEDGKNTADFSYRRPSRRFVRSKRIALRRGSRVSGQKRAQLQGRAAGQSFAVKNRVSEKPKWTAARFSRLASLFLLLALAVAGVTKSNGYTELKNLGSMAAGVIQNLREWQGQQDVILLDESAGQLIIEETQIDNSIQADSSAVQEEISKPWEEVFGPQNEAGEEAVKETQTHQATEVIASAQVVLEEQAGQEAESVHSGTEIEWTIGQKDDEKKEISVQETAVKENEVKESEMPKTREEKTQEQKSTEQESTEQKSTEQEPVVQKYQEDSRENADITSSTAAARPQYYVIQKGDSLADICCRFYGNTAKLYEICTLNKIENPNQICWGQKILLP